jgi:hypothetical protein
MIAMAKKPRKTQSDKKCEGISASTGKPCKFASHPGHRFCGTHIRAVEAFNAEVRALSAVCDSLHEGIIFLDGIVFSNCDDTPIPVFLYTTLEGQTRKQFSVPLTDVKVHDIHKSKQEDYKAFLIETRLPQEDSNAD